MISHWPLKNSRLVFIIHFFKATGDSSIRHALHRANLQQLITCRVLQLSTIILLILQIDQCCFSNQRSLPDEKKNKTPNMEWRFRSPEYSTIPTQLSEAKSRTLLFSCHEPLLIICPCYLLPLDLEDTWHCRLIPTRAGGEPQPAIGVLSGITDLVA